MPPNRVSSATARRACPNAAVVGLRPDIVDPIGAVVQRILGGISRRSQRPKRKDRGSALARDCDFPAKSAVLADLDAEKLHRPPRLRELESPGPEFTHQKLQILDDYLNPSWRIREAHSQIQRLRGNLTTM